ncbi:NAD(P)/FAD-dependent oxidoreductase [Roseibium sp.]|uniref:NAD(P)/FAD-dependent oxidoreductase n=1 Tax=Roseibium sp. TaxID=1936156 RepID=UPI003D09AEBC
MDILHVNDQPGEHAPSYYAATANEMPSYPALEEEISCDVCIVGGGYTGLSAALHLAERGYDVVLLDAHRAGWGASGRNGGQVGSGQRVEQDELEGMVGKDNARLLWDIGEDSKKLVRSLIERFNIDCDYKPGILHADHRKRFVPHSRAYAEKLQKDYGYEHIRFVDQDEIRSMLGSTAYYGGTLDTDSGHLHPLNFALGLAQAASAAGARIFERSQVTGYTQGDPVRVETARGAVKARYMILACNGYLGGLDRQVASHVMPINNFIIATEPLSDDKARELIRDDVAVGDSKFVINYYRLSADKRMLFGGGESYGYKFPKDIKGFVRSKMLEIYPQLKDVRIDYGWGGTLGITMSRLPHLARLSPNVFSSAGYSGHGVAMATLAGEVMAEAIDGTASRFDVMSNVPTPRFPGGDRLRWPLLVLAMSYYSLRDRL